MLEIPRAATSYLCYAVEDGDDRTLMPSTDENATKEKLVEILKHLSSYRDFKWRIISNHWCSIPNIKPFLTVLLVSDCNDKIKEKIKQDLITSYQNDEIENVLYIFMYLDPRFKLLLMLTEQKKRSVQSAVTSTILQRTKRQNREQVSLNLLCNWRTLNLNVQS